MVEPARHELTSDELAQVSGMTEQGPAEEVLGFVRALPAPLETVVAVLGNVSCSTEEVAEQFVKLFMDRVWKPFTASGRREDELAQVREAIERLRPMASEVLLAVFQQRMTRRVEQAFGRALDKGS